MKAAIGKARGKQPDILEMVFQDFRQKGWASRPVFRNSQRHTSSRHGKFRVSLQIPRTFQQSLRDPLSFCLWRRHAPCEALDFVRKPFPAISAESFSNTKPATNHASAGAQHLGFG